MLHNASPPAYTRRASPSTVQPSARPLTPPPHRPFISLRRLLCLIFLCLAGAWLVSFLYTAARLAHRAARWALSDDCHDWFTYSIIDAGTLKRECDCIAAVDRHVPLLSCTHSPSSRPFTFSGVVPFCPTPDAFALSNATAAQHFPHPIPQGSDGVLSLMHKWSRPSAVGVGEQRLPDPTVRRSREVAFNASTQWQPSDALTQLLDSVLKGVWRAMLRQEDIGVEPRDWSHFEWPGRWHLAVHKLLLYSEGDFFSSHSDTYKVEGQVATVIVRLPVEQQRELKGGELHVRRRGELGVEEEVVWRGEGSEAWAVNKSSDEAAEPWSRPDAKLHCGGSSGGGDGGKGGAGQVEWVAFYSDCMHEVKPVESGVRVVLVLNFIRGQLPALATPWVWPWQRHPMNKMSDAGQWTRRRWQVGPGRLS